MQFNAGSIAGVPVRVSNTFVAITVLAGVYGARGVGQAAWLTSQPPSPPADPRDLEAAAAWIGAAGTWFEDPR